jgi:LPXTG-motif cell wall-anchored protein
MNLGLLLITAKSDATAGLSGTMRLSAELDGGAAVTDDAEVRIGQPVNLMAGHATSLTPPPGKTGAVTPRVRNGSPVAVNGVVLQVSIPTAMMPGPRYRNCTYEDHGIDCTFDSVLAPGRTYAVAHPFNVRTPLGAAAGSRASFTTSWLTPSAFEDIKAEFTDSSGKPGTAAPLTLVPVASTSTLPQTDVRPYDDYSQLILTVPGARRPDLAAVGASVHGKVGDQVAVRLGMRNNGPGTLQPSLFDNQDVFVNVTLPKNLSVVKADARCGRNYDARHYSCWAPYTAVRSGASNLFSFTLKIGKGRATGGSVELSQDDIERGRNPKNNKATLAVAATAAVKADGQGGGLPITGSGTGLLIAAATLLLGGSIALLLARRRKSVAAG